MATEVQMTGVNELVAKLEGIKYEMRFKGGRSSLRKAAQLVRDRAKANALHIDDPQTRERVFMNIVERWSNKTFKATGDLAFRVGVLGGARSNTAAAARKDRQRRQRGVPSLGDLGEIEGAGDGNPGGDTYYWRFVEFGTERQAAKPFLRPALEQNAQAATDVFIAEYDKAIERVLKKADRKSY